MNKDIINQCSSCGVKIEVAGICVALRNNSSQYIRQITENYKQFISSKEPVFYMDINLSEKEFLNENSEVDIIVLGNKIKMKDENLLAEIDISNGRGAAALGFVNRKVGIATLLRNVFAMLLLNKYNGIALHAAGILNRGKVYIFTGPSKSGKTTVSQISVSLGHAILNDDLVFIRKLNSGYFVFPTPAWLHMQAGDIENRPYPIGGIFKLCKDDKIFVENIPRGRALAEIFTIPGIPQQFLQVQWLLDRFYDIIKEHPYYGLHFKKEESFWKCINILY